MVIKEFKTPITNESVYIGPSVKDDVYILAIESSCDETACAIVLNGRTVVSNVVATQIPIHQLYGGVVPEVAAREHLESINLVIEQALKQAEIKPEQITAFASTMGPGLVGCLLVGLNAAKALSLVYDRPYIGVNHLNAHICANYLGTDLEPPFVGLLVSGGHSQIIKVNSYTDIELIGETVDDAIGEAYDKVARLLGIPYPGGVNLDKMAQQGDKSKFHFTKPKVGEFEFSFSGLKTAVLRLTQEIKKQGLELPKEDIAASFQETVSDILLNKTLNAAKKYDIKTLVLAGGVAANSELRKKFFAQEQEGYKVFAPPMKFCTDNASMVASSAYFLAKISDRLDVEVFSRASR